MIVRGFQRCGWEGYLKRIRAVGESNVISFSIPIMMAKVVLLI